MYAVLILDMLKHIHSKQGVTYLLNEKIQNVENVRAKRIQSTTVISLLIFYTK